MFHFGGWGGGTVVNYFWKCGVIADRRFEDNYPIGNFEKECNLVFFSICYNNFVT